MATQTMGNQTVAVVPEERTERFGKVKEFFGNVKDCIDLYFNGGVDMEQMIHRSRSERPVHEKSEVDSYMNRIGWR